MSNSENSFTNGMTMLALRGLVVFPGLLMHFDAGRKKSIQAIETAMKESRLVFLVSQRDVKVDEPMLSDLYTVGTVSRVRQILKLPGGNVRVLVEGIHRAELVNITKTVPYLTAELRLFDEKPVKGAPMRIEAMVRKSHELFEEYLEMVDRMPDEIVRAVLTEKNPGRLADMIAQHIQAEYTDKQRLLEEPDPVHRLYRTLELLTSENGILHIEQTIENKVRAQMDKNQREYYLREQIRVIQEELGEGADGISDAEDYRKKIAALHLQEETEKKLMGEAARLARTQANSPESAVIRTYLDTCLSLPWNKTTREKTNLAHAEKILNDDHYGLEKVKERVLEFLAVRSLSKGQGSQILCLIGPPGTGKTSIASSVARASGRKFARLSLGGVRDEADIRGHRKTYIGAMPGRIVNALVQAGSKNCVLLLDEVDKMGSDFRGDPSAALLEALDSAQNTAFRDHYIEVPFDLSQVMFITTANSYETIPRPLLDRMEVIDIEGYTDEEKLQIAFRHLLPKALKKHGLRRNQLSVSEDAMRKIIADYTRESGVRSLDRCLSKLCRKAARTVAEEEKSRLSVTPERLHELLGAPKYRRETQMLEDRVGVVNGLAWTSVGGEMLEVEAGAVDGTGKLELTGNLGNVMKESVKAAITFIRSQKDVLGISGDFYSEKDLHIHFPEGATPKDGPSAGIAAFTAIVSALTGRPVRGTVAMTGEITLRGRVLPIGGLKEKTMAAYRSGISTVIIPEENLPDLEEIDQTVRAGLRFIPVRDAGQVLKEALLPPCGGTEKATEELSLQGVLSQHVDGTHPAMRQ